MKQSFLLIAVMALLMAPLAAQSVKVVSPNGGESWVLHSSHAITWTSTNPGSQKVDIVLRNTGGKVGAIKSQVALSSGGWQWQDVGRLEDGTMAPAGTDYIIRIRDSGNTYSDDSNANFAISGTSPAPTLRLLIPNGGENWYRSKLNNITWKAENWTGTVNLSLFQNNVFKGVIASGQPSSAGAYSWNVGATSHGMADLGGGYRVMVSRTYPGPQLPQAALVDKSDGDFSIGLQKIPGIVRPVEINQAKTVSLTPSLSNKWHRKHEYCNALGCPLTSGGLAPDPDPSPLLRTGYRNNYDGGLCWEYLGFIYRGIVRFDLSQIKGQIKEAHVSMICTGTDSTDGTPYCDGSVMVLDGGGSGFDNPCHHYVDLPAGGGPVANDVIKVSGPNIQIVVTDLVKAWIGGQQPNHGLLFLGNNEGMSENDDRCISHFQVALSITYVPSDSWDME